MLTNNYLLINRKWLVSFRMHCYMTGLVIKLEQHLNINKKPSSFGELRTCWPYDIYSIRFLPIQKAICIGFRLLTIIQTYRRGVNHLHQKTMMKDKSVSTSPDTKRLVDTLFTSVKSLSDVILTINTEQACIRQEGWKVV